MKHLLYSAMEKYGLLDQTDEGWFCTPFAASSCAFRASANSNIPIASDALHKSRLLNVEEKPFKRITKRLLTPSSLVSNPTAALPTPPPESEDADANLQHEAEKQKLLDEYRQFREDVILDFSAFENSISRIQFLLSSNAKERERYAVEKERILSTAQEVKDNTAGLRNQLDEAQRTLALRKTYDELADKITSNRLLRPREDQTANLEKLNAEIAKLETESMEYAQTWAERREQFGRIVEEGMNLRRLIRDEKEEVERREGMEEGEEGDEGEMGSKGRVSSAGTPRPDQDSGLTPSQPGPEDTTSTSEKLQPEKSRSEGTRPITPLRQSMTASETVAEENPATQETENGVDEGEVTGDGTGGDSADEIEEGEELSDHRLADKMDVT